MNKTKQEIEPLQTRLAAECCMTALAHNLNRRRLITADLDAAITQIKESYAPKLAALEPLIAEQTAQLKAWAELPGSLPADAKSVNLLCGTVGFRLDPPSLGLIRKKRGWNFVLDILLARRHRKFLRVRTDVDKEAILAKCGTLARPTKWQQRWLKMLGLKIVQENQFFIEAALTDADKAA